MYNSYLFIEKFVVALSDDTPWKTNTFATLLTCRYFPTEFKYYVSRACGHTHITQGQLSALKTTKDLLFREHFFRLSYLYW